MSILQRVALIAVSAIYLLAPVHTFCQPTAANCEECLQFQYPFNVCNPLTKQVVSICANNPYDLPYPLRFNQICPVVNVVFSDFGGPGDLYLQTVTGSIPLYRRSKSQSDILWAQKMWTDICNELPRSDCQPCQFIVGWAREPEDMENHLTHGAETNISYDGNTCNRNCFFSKTLLNWTSDFKAGNAQSGLPRRGFYNDFYPSYYPEGSDLGYFHLQTFLQHEYGHFMGFAGYREMLCPPMTLENTENCQMNDHIDYEEERLNLCIWDKCQYIVTYCCSTVGIADETQENFEASSTAKIHVPSPESAWMTVSQFSELINGCSDVEAAIVTMNGRTIGVSTHATNDSPENRMAQVLKLESSPLLLVLSGCGETEKIMITTTR